MEKVNGLTLPEWIDSVKKPYKPTLWGQEYPEYSPCVCETIIGDGLQLIAITTTDQRPCWWYVRIDSSTNIKSDDFDLEGEVLDLIEEECGVPQEEDFASEDDWMQDNFHYPMFLWNGGFYYMVVNMVTREYN